MVCDCIKSLSLSILYLAIAAIQLGGHGVTRWVKDSAKSNEMLTANAHVLKERESNFFDSISPVKIKWSCVKFDHTCF